MIKSVDLHQHYNVNEVKFFEIQDKVEQTDGLWKIEADNHFEGGRVTWKGQYRFRHFLTGKFLSVHKIENKFRLVLTTEADSNSLFLLEHMAKKSEEQSVSPFISKDSFFRIQNIATKLWIGFKDEIYNVQDTELRG